jgi:hypothetical protein
VNWVRLNKEKKMKKLVIGAAALACASIVSAQTVTSANIVGYAKNVKVPGSFAMIGVAWNSDTLGNIVGYDHVSTSLSYATYYLFDDGTTKEWRSTATPNESPTEPIIVKNGSAIWFEQTSGSETEMITTGEVNATAETTNSIAAGFSMLSFPFSADIASLDELALTEQGKAATFDFLWASADKIYKWSPSGYETYFLFDRGRLGRTWRSTANVGEDLSTPVSLLIGEGFFYETDTPFNWIETNPYFSNL